METLSISRQEELTPDENQGLRKIGPLYFPNTDDPFQFARENINLTYQDQPNKIIGYHGTTTLAFIYKGGIVVAVDSRATGGSFVFSQSVMKIIQIAPNMVGTMAGGAADCIFWLNILKKVWRLHKFTEQTPLTVAAASKRLVNALCSYKGMGISLGSMICGYDINGPHIFYIDSDGNRVSGKLFSVGSGSTHAYGVLDTCYKEDMTKEEAIDLGKKAIYHATYRDAGSGGRVNVCHITQDGCEFFDPVDVFDIHDFSKK